MDVTEAVKTKIFVKELLLSRGWTIVHNLGQVGTFPSELDLVVYKENRGYIGVIVHKRESTDKYCVRRAQINTYSEWDSPVYVVFDNGQCVNVDDMKAAGARRNGNAHHQAYYELPLGNLFMRTFGTVFG